MTDLFMYVISLSIKGCVVISLIILVRFLIRKQPKIYSYALWFVVFAGLVFNIKITFDKGSFYSPVSDLHQRADSRYAELMDDYVGDVDVHYSHKMEYYQALERGIQPVYDWSDGFRYVVTAKNTISPPPTFENTTMPKLANIWAAGILVALFVLLKNLGSFHARLQFAQKAESNIYFADNITSPFVYGVLKPRVYIPSAMADMPLDSIIRHEQTHIRRGDHIVKPLALAVAVLHWFNPLVWLAFRLMCRDMEMSCDEAVIKNSTDKKEYSLRLLNCAVEKHTSPARAVLFGETDAENRIKNVLSYRKPAKIVSLLLIAVVAISATACVVEEKVTEKIPSKIPPTFYEQLAKLNSTEDVQYKERELIETHLGIKNTDVMLASEMGVTTVMPPEITANSISRYGLGYNCLTGTVTQTKDGPFSSFAYVLKDSEKLQLCYADEREYAHNTVDMPQGHKLLCVATGLEVLGDNLEFLSYYTEDSTGEIWLNIHRIKDNNTEIFQHKMNKDNMFILRGLRFINENVGFMGETERGCTHPSHTAGTVKFHDPVANITIDGGKTWYQLDFSQLVVPDYFTGYHSCCMVVLDKFIEIRYFTDINPELKEKTQGVYPFSTSTESYSIISEDGGLTWTGYLRVRNVEKGIGYTHQKVTDTIPVQIID